MSNLIEHGTYAGSRKCWKRREGACPACRRASADYQRNRRQGLPREVKAAEHEKAKARIRALWRLADLHRDQFYRFLDEELAKTGEMAA